MSKSLWKDHITKYMEYVCIQIVLPQLERRYPGCQRLFLQVFRFQSNPVTRVRSLATCGSSLRPKICRPAAYTEAFRRTQKKKNPCYPGYSGGVKTNTLFVEVNGLRSSLFARQSFGKALRFTNGQRTIRGLSCNNC